MSGAAQDPLFMMAMHTHLDGLPWVVYRGPVIPDAGDTPGRGPEVLVYDCPIIVSQDAPHRRGVLWLVTLAEGVHDHTTVIPAYVEGGTAVPGQPTAVKIGLSTQSIQDALNDAAEGLGVTS